MDVINTRRSVRAYTDKHPDDELINELLKAAVQAPTAMHQEQWGFAVVQNKVVLKRNEADR